MSIQLDQFTNTISVNDTVNANSSLNLIGQGTGAVTLKGTGTNMIPYSQSLATGSGWVTSNSTATNNATTAPDSTSTASSLIESATTATHWQFTTQTPILLIGTYTMSVYAKANGRTVVIAGIAYNGSGTTNYGTVTFDLSGVAVTQTNANGYTVVSSSITSVGSGWYRCVATINVASVIGGILTVVGISNATTYTVSNYGMNSYAGNGTSGLYLWGVQLEPYSTVGTYVPTTTTPLLGSPTLSLSNLSVIGLQNDGALYLQPYTTGALQAQATTSSTTGGNARGANAVDWQTSRSAASMIASSNGAVISGGLNNTASGSRSVVGGGDGNNASNFWSVISGGLNNTVSGSVSFNGAGQSNTVAGARAAVVTGRGNNASGEFNFIGGGYANSGTATAAVTTQSGTMNGTTAVTLSGSNANIKVGQFISGTFLPSEVYVAAISGTSLTLSSVASGSGTATLSFYTPHGVVVGGGNNQATGAYSFIGGGGDAGTAGNRNVASGDWSFVGGGGFNVAGGQSAAIGGGGILYSNFYGNSANGDASVISGGAGNNASAIGSAIPGGYSNQASGSYSFAAGRTSGTRGIYGAFSFASGNYSANADSQTETFVLSATTTNATITELYSLGAGSASNSSIPVLPAPSASTSSVYTFRGLVSAKDTATTNAAGWEIKGVIQRTGAGVGTVALVGTPSITLLGATSGITSTWGQVANVTVTADTTNGGISVNVTGAASTTIRWNCRLDTSELA